LKTSVKLICEYAELHTYRRKGVSTKTLGQEVFGR